MLVLGLLGTFLTPPYLMLAWPQNVPGLHIRLKCLRLVLRLLLKRRGPIDLKMVSGLLFYPLDSTRYFEVDFVWRTLSDLPVGKYLDVSSPRLVFTLLLWRHHQLEADLINPDKADLAETERLLRASGLLPRSRLHNAVITQASLVPNSYDTITSVSVVEHIPDDRQAIKTIWDLLKPGGRFLLTVPCAAASSEQFIDTDEYGLYGGDKGTHVFWQRFYDPALLQERVFAITGRPVRQIIFGECEPGLFLRNATEKRTNRYYPFWREPYMVGQEYRYFDSVNELPGEGVIAMEFQKR
jgi:SAM-dependent methyltransferase